MINNRLIVLLLTVLSLVLFTDCNTVQHKKGLSHTKIRDNSELVVAMDIEMPGYFDIEGENYGYHYEMLRAYAEKLGVTLRIITGKTHAECQRMLSQGEADIVASLASDSCFEAEVIPIYTTSYVLLAGPSQITTGRKHKALASIGNLRGKRILISSGFKASKHYSMLLDSLRNTPKFISERHALEMIASLSNNEYDYLICEKSEALVGANMYSNVRSVYDFPNNVPVHVALNPANKELKEDFKMWLESYRSCEEYTRLDGLYMENGSFANISTFRNTVGNALQSISAYDDIIRKVALQEELDWRFLSAIAYHESRFKAHVVSNKGAKGLMQIMPVVARHFNISQEKVADPETNVMLAAKLLNNIENSMKLPYNTSYHDKMSIVLACYNAGAGHIADARRLAMKYGYSSNSWADVSHFLKLKAQPEYYDDVVVRNGVFRGSKQTLAFVNNVIGQYNSYCILAQK